PKPATPAKPSTPQPATPTKLVTPKQNIPQTSQNKANTPSKRTPKPSTPVRPSSLRKDANSHSAKNARFESPFKSATSQDRTVSGLGIDQRGLGSPAVALKLARRKSLGEGTIAFSPIAVPGALLKNLKKDVEAEEREKEEEEKRRQEEIKNMDLRS